MPGLQDAAGGESPRRVHSRNRSCLVRTRSRRDKIACERVSIPQPTRSSWSPGRSAGFLYGCRWMASPLSLWTVSPLNRESLPFCVLLPPLRTFHTFSQAQYDETAVGHFHEPNRNLAYDHVQWRSINLKRIYFPVYIYIYIYIQSFLNI